MASGGTDAAVAAGTLVAVDVGEGAIRHWPADGSGALWEVHHFRELGFGGGDSPFNYLPLPPLLHAAVSAMWNDLRAIPEVRAALAGSRQGRQVESSEI